jgi:hypothetical protein
MGEETVQDIWFISDDVDERDLEDEMDRADMLLDLGIRGEWREWGDEDNLDIED